MRLGFKLGLVAGVVALLAAGVGAQDVASRTVWDGVYTDAQAERGEKLYADQCAACHGADMKAGAGAPSLAGPEFTFGWEKKPLGGLFDFMRANMPPGQAGSLKDDEYAAILAAMLKRNGFPSATDTTLATNKAELDNVTFLTDKP